MVLGRNATVPMDAGAAVCPPLLWPPGHISACSWRASLSAARSQRGPHPQEGDVTAQLMVTHSPLLCN